MTELLYYQDAYLKESHAKVLAVEGKKILLDKTIFFPDMPGKPGDRGRINGIPVLGAIIQGPDVWHVLEGEHRLKAGDAAHLQLDWRRRHYLMRLHAAIHVLSAVFVKYFRLYPASNRLTESGAYLEFAKEVGIQTIGDGLQKSYSVSKEGAQVDAYFEESSGRRYVRIGYFPEFPCNGLFVRDVKEIGTMTLESAGMDEGRFVLVVKVE